MKMRYGQNGLSFNIYLASLNKHYSYWKIFGKFQRTIQLFFMNNKNTSKYGDTKIFDGRLPYQFQEFKVELKYWLVVCANCLCVQCNYLVVGNCLNARKRACSKMGGRTALLQRCLRRKFLVYKFRRREYLAKKKKEKEKKKERGREKGKKSLIVVEAFFVKELTDLLHNDAGDIYCVPNESPGNHFQAVLMT